MNDPGLNFYTTVDPPTYAWSPTWQFAYTDQTMTTGHGTTGLTPGERVYVGFIAKNVGNLPWANSAAGAVSVATVVPFDRSSAFYDPTTWTSPNRPGTMKEATVMPGQSGTFGFWIKAPSSPGTYVEHFSLVAGNESAGNQAVMYDPGLNFYITVQ
jgi:hypothetical protein